MQQLYPMKFHPVFREKIWGGQKINRILDLGCPYEARCGEAWLISGVAGDETTVAQGFLKDNELNELVEVYMGELVGEQVFEKYGNEFPVLVKVIDANDWLSIQVHPDDELALRRHGSQGKTEMWYILDSDEDSVLISGFGKKVDKKEYLRHLQNNTLKEILNFEAARPGDVFYIPSGRVHALGPGIMLAEIQQTSDITYRIYDWDRISEAGVKRELHTDQALDAIDFGVHENYRTEYKKEKDKTSNILVSPYFTVNMLSLNLPVRKDYAELDSFVIYMCVDGKAIVRSLDTETTFDRGEAILLPAVAGTAEIHPLPGAEILEIYMNTENPGKE